MARQSGARQVNRDVNSELRDFKRIRSYIIILWIISEKLIIFDSQLSFEKNNIEQFYAQQIEQIIHLPIWLFLVLN